MSNVVKVKINGKPYEIEVGDLATSPVHVIVNGTAYQVEIEGREAAVSAAAPVVQPSMQVVAAPAAPARAAAQPGTGSEKEVCSPMPGVILDVMVKAGQAVSAGQQLCALEAMKMKSAIHSPRDGTLAGVEVTDGQKVAYGDVLVRFN